LSLRILKLVFALVIGGFVLSGAYISVLMNERQDTLRQLSRYNAAWEAGKAVSEFLRLEQRLSEFGAPDSPVDRDEVALRYDIVVNRVKILTEGQFQIVVEPHPDQQSTLRRFQETIAAVEPLIQALERPDSARKVLEMLRPLEGELARLASVAHAYGSERVTADQQELFRLHWQFSALVVALIVFGIVLIGLLDHHIRLLGRAHQEVHFLAHHDALTGLANRVLFYKQLDQALAHVGHSGGALTVLYLDLDGFKDVNDAFGHAIGDALLKAVAGRLRSCVREGDVVARLGGDEFAILQAGVTNPYDSTVLASCIIATVGAPYDLDGQQIVIGTSIGIALALDSSATPDLLLKQADQALYRAKGAGRGTFRFFEPEMQVPSGQPDPISEREPSQSVYPALPPHRARSGTASQ
jgi:diguanylate cyclase (GGDEF)-like protein